MSTIKSNAEKIFNWLDSGKTITRQQAFFMFGINDLPDVIRKLKNRGHDIESTKVERINQNKRKIFVSQYKLIK